MQLGGPVWHVSAATPGLAIPALLEAECRRQLAEVGDASLGEWPEWTGHAFHLRRRLNTREQRKVGPVVDIRGTQEARQRAQRLGTRLKLVPAEVLAEEIGVPQDD